MKTKRIFLTVLDSLGIGELPDAADFGDVGSYTLRSISKSPFFTDANMKKLGLGCIDGQDFIGKVPSALGAYARMTEKSKGKDTTIGHWEIAGLVSDSPLPTYPDGFSKEILDEFCEKCGRGYLCNKPYSGTEVIKDYGEEHVKTGKLIVYTSADSVFQIAAHEDVVPLEKLYEYCLTARDILKGENGVGRVIARPFVGNAKDGFTRTANRRDFSLKPIGKTMLDALKENGKDVIAVGKITDIFASCGVTESIITHGNTEGMDVTYSLLNRDFNGLCFANLVDFDMLYGHRNNVDGYAKAFSEFDLWLEKFIPEMKEDDVLIITADHGCDPGDISTDHTREYTPLIIFGAGIKPVNLGTRDSFADISATVCELLGVPFTTVGKSAASLISKD